MDNAVHWCDCGMGEMMMSEFCCVGDLGRLGGFCHNCVALVVLERYTDISARCTAEFPQVSCPGIFLCDYVASEGSNWCNVVLNGPWKYDHADIEGSRIACRRRLRVISV